MNQLVKTVAGNLINKGLNSIGRKYKGKSLRGTKPPVKQMKLYKQVMSGNVHLFKQKNTVVQSGTLSASGYAVYARVFTLSDLANVTEFTSLFDQYRIRKIKHTIMSVAQSSNEGGTHQDIYGGMVVDPDDSSVAGWVNFNEISQYNDWRPRKLTNLVPIKRYFTPAVNNEIQTGINPAFSQSLYKPLLDMASPTVPHLGIKVAIYGTPSVTYKLIETTTYYIECRTKR